MKIYIKEYIEKFRLIKEFLKNKFQTLYKIDVHLNKKGREFSLTLLYWQSSIFEIYLKRFILVHTFIDGVFLSKRK